MSELFEAPSLEYLGEHLPQFEFEDFIAQGGMGAVYRARQISLDRLIAIKVLPHELGENEEFRDSFAKEARAMAKLNHPNLIGVYDSGDVDGMPYIAMEYIEGSSLHDACWGKKLESDQAVDIVKGICDGLADAHKHGIIHRDIKPANILLTTDATPKIGDFGLAHPSDSEESGLVMGTPGYTAPEIFEDANLAGVLADQYSVGMILHQLLTGIDPAGTEGPPTEPTSNLRLDAIWRKATQMDPAERYPTIADMAAALNQWKLSKTTAAVPVPGQSPGQVPARAPGRALNVGAPVNAPAPPVQLKSAKSGGILVKLILLSLLAAGGWYGYQHYKSGQDPVADNPLPGTSSPDTPPNNPSSRPKPPKPNNKPTNTGTSNRNTASNPDKKPSNNNRLSRKEQRERRNRDSAANPNIPIPDIPSPSPVIPSTPALPPGDPQLRDKAVSLILDARKKRDALLQKNSQEYRRLLEYESARAARSDSRKYLELHKESRSGWVPEPDDMPNVSESVSRAHRTAHSEQLTIQSKHMGELKRIRDFYVPMLQKAASTTSDEGQKERLLAQADRASNLDRWVQLLAPEGNR